MRGGERFGAAAGGERLGEPGAGPDVTPGAIDRRSPRPLRRFRRPPAAASLARTRRPPRGRGARSRRSGRASPSAASASTSTHLPRSIASPSVEASRRSISSRVSGLAVEADVDLEVEQRAAPRPATARSSRPSPRPRGGSACSFRHAAGMRTTTPARSSVSTSERSRIASLRGPAQGMEDLAGLDDLLQPGCSSRSRG